MFVLVFLFLFSIASTEKAPPYNIREGPAHFEDFIQAHRKVYNSKEEKAMRYGIFLMNLERINKLNAENKYTEFGINQFTDLTLEEFRARVKCFETFPNYSDDGKPANSTITNRIRSKSLDIPSQFDWREKNVVTRVKDQGQCGSCWAFSTTGNVESINAIKTNQLTELSEQQLVDCDTSDQGCNGGLPTNALQYFMGNGAMSSTSYPYQGTEGTCQYQSQNVAVRVTNYVTVSGSEDDIAEKLVNIGPLSIGIDATQLSSYKSGVLNGNNCQGQNIDHAVLLVGYGVDSASGLQYWIVKNSWGQGWGDQGYFKMQRGVNCLGVTDNPPVSAVI